NIDVAMQDVQNAVAAARRRLPIDIDPPVIAKVNPNNLPVMWLTLSASSKEGVRPLPLKKISDFAEKEFKQHLMAVHPDVGGLQSRNTRIHHDAFKLAAYNLSAEDLAQAVQRQHAELPAGYIQSKLTEANLRTMGEAYTLKEFNKLVLLQRAGQQINLGDVAV